MTFHDHNTARLRAVVSAALGRVDALLAAAADPPSDAQPWTPVTMVGGPNLDLAPRTGFADPRWCTGYRPGPERGVYVATCSDLNLLADRLGAGLAKIGTCAPARLADRMDELRRDRTGAAYSDGERYLRSRDGWTDWFARSPRPLGGPSPGSPVDVAAKMLVVRLPDTLRWQDFDVAFDARVRQAALDRWAMSEEGDARCIAVGLPPRRLQRFTPYGGGGDVRVSPATEIALFDPVTGPDRLVRIVEDVLLEHVLKTSD